MAIKVVSKVPPKSLVKKRLCKHCGATLEYLPSDVKTDYLSSMCEPAGGYDWIKCPHCARQVVVREW